MVSEIDRLIQEGRAAALAGDSIAARAAFRRATELEPANAEAWIGLSSAVPILAEKRTYLQRVLAIDPANDEAQASLAYVDKLIAEGMQLAPSQRLAERRASGDASPLLSAPEPEVTPGEEVLHCYIHPERETGLRCVQCGRPICGQCAKPAAVGQLCPECRKERRPNNYKVEPKDLIIGGLLALGIGVVASIGVVLVTQVPFIGLFLALGSGALVANLVVRASDRITQTKRGRAMQIALTSGLAIGTVPLIVFALLSSSFFFIAIAILYLVLACIATIANLR